MADARTTGRRSPQGGGHVVRQDADVSAALDALRRIVRALGISARTAERTVGVTGAQLLVLQILSEARPPMQSLNELADRTFTHQSTVSVVVERLVKRGLVTRTRSASDARRILLALTAAGRAALHRAPPPAQIRLIQALDQLGPRHRRALARGLEAIVRTMGLADEPAAMFFEEGRAGTAPSAARAPGHPRQPVGGRRASGRRRPAKPGTSD
jgi:MarR family transcriptional regulator, lower aerobic nicotinate degradation pathway regulator